MTAPRRPTPMAKEVGGTSPFGTRRPMPVYMERSNGELPYLYLNGGRHGYDSPAIVSSPLPREASSPSLWSGALGE